MKRPELHKEQGRQWTWKGNNEVRWCNHCWRGKAFHILSVYL